MLMRLLLGDEWSSCSFSQLPRKKHGSGRQGSSVFLFCEFRLQCWCLPDVVIEVLPVQVPHASAACGFDLSTKRQISRNPILGLEVSAWWMRVPSSGSPP